MLVSNNFGRRKNDPAKDRKALANYVELKGYVHGGNRKSRDQFGLLNPALIHSKSCRLSGLRAGFHNRIYRLSPACMLKWERSCMEVYDANHYDC